MMSPIGAELTRTTAVVMSGLFGLGRRRSNKAAAVRRSLTKF